MPPKVNLVARQAIEAAAVAQAAEKRKNRPAGQADHYELKRIQRGTRDDLAQGDAVRMEVGATLAGSPGVGPLAIPLVKVVGGVLQGRST